MTIEEFYRDSYLREIEGEIKEIMEKDGKLGLILDRTIFYPTGGGQPCDKGEIVGKGFKFEVEEVLREGEEILHIGRAEGELRKGRVLLKIDWNRRYDLMQQHTGQHILSAAILKKMGIVSTGFQIFDDFSKIEIEYEGELSWDLIKEIELEANKAARKCLKVEVSYGKMEGLRKSPTSFHGEFRVVKIGDYDKCGCGGLHVKLSSEVLPIKVLRFYRKTSKVWRIEFVCGDRALKVINSLLRERESALNLLGKREGNLAEEVRNLLERLDKEREKERNWREKYIKEVARALALSSFEVQGRRVCFGEAEAGVADKICEELSEFDFVILKDKERITIYSKEGLAKSLLHEIQRLKGGRGGGSKEFVRGKLNKEISKDDVLEAIKSIYSVPSQ